jgi:hypothetical protein
MAESAKRRPRIPRLADILQCREATGPLTSTLLTRQAAAVVGDGN